MNDPATSQCARVSGRRRGSAGDVPAPPAPPGISATAPLGRDADARHERESRHGHSRCRPAGLGHQAPTGAVAFAHPGIRDGRR
ncbi:hypothetical protein [Rossellomorea vietnamensis]|uniref:hypothetical protein n=1 Tax=Rossellomorea vietnamensis TaxID=218284 RepID=UPI001364B4D8